MPTCHVRIRAYAPQRWSRLLFAAALVAVALVAGILGFTRAAQAAAITVNTTTDEYNTGPNCSLREAIQAANTDTAFGGCAAGSGADTITLPSGTYQSTINPGPDENANAAGDFDIASSITIQGAGAGSTFVDGGGVDRVFDVAPTGGPAITVGFSGLTIQNGKGLNTNFGVGGAMFINSNATVNISNSALANNQSTTGTGGAIENRGTLTLNTVTMQNNTALSLGGAVNSAASGGGGGLTVINSTLTGNNAERGGAIYFSTDAGTNASISGSTFTGNQAVATSGGAGDDGGAIAIDTDGAVNIIKSTFTGNNAAANGGAIYFNDSATQAAVAALTMSYNRIAGNTAAAGSGLFYASGTATAERNWWGCNSGPAAGPCSVVSGNADFTPWIILTHTANPSTVGTGQAATLTAGFLTNSDGSANTAGSLGALAGVPVSFGSAVLGTLSGAQSAVQANGTATATYTAGATPGAGSAAATVDSATVTANLTVNQPPSTTVTSLTRSGASPTNSTTVTWTVVFGSPVTGLAAGNFALVPSGVAGATVSGVTGSGISWTVTATTTGGDGTLGLNLVNTTGLDKALTNLPFTGEVYTIDTNVPDTQIDSGPPTPSASSTATFTFSGFDAGGSVTTFNCSLDAAAFAACTSPQTYSGLTNGSHTFQVRAVDAAGNVDPTPATYTWSFVAGGTLQDRLYLPLLVHQE
jgi:CSLREA domain-containing protein